MRLHLADAKAREFYAIQRIDLLVISVAGAGIYLVFESLKFVLENKLCVNMPLLELGGILFVAAILCNFASQWAGYYTNKNEACWAQLEHKALSGETLDNKQLQAQADYDEKADCWSLGTRIRNITSTILLLSGVILLMVFNITSFGAA